jgi:hypothetical protein
MDGPRLRGEETVSVEGRGCKSGCGQINVSSRRRWGCRGWHRVRIHDIYATAGHSRNDWMPSGVRADGAESVLLVVLARWEGRRELRRCRHARRPAGMRRLENPACLERKAVIVDCVELEASIRHVGDFPSTRSVIHANLRHALLAFSRRYHAHHLPRAPVIFRFGIVVDVSIILRLDN